MYYLILPQQIPDKNSQTHTQHFLKSKNKALAMPLTIASDGSNHPQLF